ncbi:MAG: mucoidy inhibitor MuiA family protein [Crocinitomicaceae bacterium]|nr:mucoidy inhibitor MuiA family protein [Crocinitomicaceae bacterium]
MKIRILFLITLFGAFSSFSQKEVGLLSDIKKITVFFQGAQLEHYKSADLKPGKQEVVFQKLTDFIDPNSVQVKAKGNLTILSVRTRKNYEDLKMTDSEIEELNAKKKKLELTDQVLRDEYEILALDKNLLMHNRDLKGTDNGLKVSELKEAYTFMHTKLAEIGTRQTAIYNELDELTKEMNRIEQEIVSQRSKPVVNYSEIVVEIDVDEATKAEFFFSYISPRAAWKPYYDMRSDGIGKPVRLEAKALVSQTTGIAWNNVDLVLSTNDPYENSKEPTLNPWYLTYYNYPQQQQVYQRQIPQTDYSGEKLRGEVIDASTGEPLPFAKITFPSNPNVGAVTDFDGKFEIMVPKNERYVIASYVGYNTTQLSITAPYLKFFIQPQELMLEEVVVSSEYERYAPESYDAISVQSISRKDIQRIPSVGNRDLKKSKSRSQEYMQATATANGSAANSWSSNATATVTKKDLRVEYAIQSKFSIPTDGIDHRVHISNYELPASYEYHAAPKMDPSVYLAAQVSGWEKLNLLNGESNLYFDGTYIGKTFIDVNSTKDTLSFSLGKDNKIQIERKRIQEKSTNRTIGSRQKFEVTWEIKVKNNGGASIPIIIKDQFPISTDSDIKVKKGDYLEGKLDEKTGILTWSFLLAPSQSKSLLFDYSVDYMHGKVLYIE